MTDTPPPGEIGNDPRVPVDRPDQAQQARERLLRIGNQAARTTENDFKAEELHELCEFLELDHDGLTKGQMIAKLQLAARDVQEHEAQQRAKSMDEGDREWYPPQPHEDFGEGDGAGLHFAYRCTACGRHPIVFRQGFDPRDPGYDEGGNRLLFPFWPMKFRSWSHTPAHVLRTASRERPRCHFCNARVPLFQGGRNLLARAIVAFEDADLRQPTKLPSVASPVDPNAR